MNFVRKSLKRLRDRLFGRGLSDALLREKRSARASCRRLRKGFQYERLEERYLLDGSGLSDFVYDGSTEVFAADQNWILESRDADGDGVHDQLYLANDSGALLTQDLKDSTRVIEIKGIKKLDLTFEIDVNVPFQSFSFNGNSSSQSSKAEIVNIDSGLDATWKGKAGDIKIVQADRVVISADMTAAVINITGNDDANDGDIKTQDDIFVKSGVRLRSTVGSVLLQAGDDLSLEAGSTVASAGDIFLYGDYGNADDAGSVMKIEGNLSGSDIYVSGDHDKDEVIYSPASVSSYAIIIGDNISGLGSGGDDDLIDASTSSGGAIIYGGPGADTIYGSASSDIVFGGDGGDKIEGRAGQDYIFGDHAHVEFEFLEDDLLMRKIASTNPGDYGDDTITGGEDGDVILGGSGEDWIDAGTGDARDIVAGDNALMTFEVISGESKISSIKSLAGKEGGDDFILTGDGKDIVLGGVGSDFIQATSESTIDSDIVIGDNGSIVFDAATEYMVEMSSQDPAHGGDDQIIVGNGRDFVIGGVGSDYINIDPVTGYQYGPDRGFSQEKGRDLILGDNGSAEFLIVTNYLNLNSKDMVVDLIETSYAEHGSGDYIYSGDGADVVIGGSGADMIYASDDDAIVADKDVVMGDNGVIEFVVHSIDFGNLFGNGNDFCGNSNPNFPRLFLASPYATVFKAESLRVHDKASDAPTYHGGPDLIYTFDGGDLVIGGDHDDVIQAGKGNFNDIVLGDYGSTQFHEDSENLLNARSTDFEYGGNDYISSGNGRDYLIGGVADDVLLAAGTDSCTDYVMGDSARARFTNKLNVKDLKSLGASEGGDDFITTGLGSDHVIAGGDDSDEGINDVVLASSFLNDQGLNEGALIALYRAGEMMPNFEPGDAVRDIVIGDNAEIDYENKTGELLYAMTIKGSKGGDDYLETGSGPDVVIGGAEDDVILAGNLEDNARDQVIGDNGRITFNGSETLDEDEKDAILSLNFSDGSEASQVTGLAGAEGARTGNWNNLPGTHAPFVDHSHSDDNPDHGTHHPVYGDSSCEQLVFHNGDLAPGIVVDWGKVFEDTYRRELEKDLHDQIDAGDDQDKRLFKGYQHGYTEHTIGVDVQGLARLFKAYDVYVYLDSDDARSSDDPGTQKITANGQSYYLNDPRGHHFEGTYQRVTATTPETAEAGNYVVFENVSLDHFELRIDDYFYGTHAQSDNVPSIAAVQIMSAADKGQRYAIDRMESIELEHVGDDRIVTGGGADLVIGGGGADQVHTYGEAIYGEIDNDVVTGDSGRMTLVYAPDASLDELRDVYTIAASETKKDKDVIVTGNGEDLVIGGNSADDIRTGVAGDFVYQDVKIISVNFAGGQLHGNDVLKGQVNGVAGTVAAANWNNLVNEQGQGSQSAGNLEFSDGVSSGVGIEWGANMDQNWSSHLDLDLHDGMSPDTQNERMLYTSHVKDPNNTVDVNLSGLSGEFASYDVYVYLETDTQNLKSDPAVMSITDGSTAYYLADSKGNTFKGTFVEVGSEDAENPGTGNFVVFRDLSGDDFRLQIRDDHTLSHAWFRPGIAGLQVVGGAGKDDVVLTGDFEQDFVAGDNARASLLNQVPYVVTTTDIQNIEAGIQSDRIQAGDESDIIIGGNDGDNLVGDEGHDRIIGDNATVYLYDGDIGCLPEILADPNGNNGTVRDVDHISGLVLHYVDPSDGTTLVTGNDRLEGSQDDDVLYGMSGDDTYAFVGGGLSHDRIVEAADDETLFNDLHDGLDFSEFAMPIVVDLGRGEKQLINGELTDQAINLEITLFTGSSLEDVVGSQFDDRIIGNLRNNNLSGGEGFDDIQVPGGDNMMSGGSEDDRLIGGPGKDEIHGGEGEDEIRGNGEDDQLYGDEGDDRIYGDSGDDLIEGGDGDDYAEGSFGDDTILGKAGHDEIHGGEGDDHLEGNADNDWIDGGLHDDYISGEGGHDELIGWHGNDEIHGKGGNDKIDGGTGNDVLAGGGGHDNIFGGHGDGLPNNDIIRGQGGNDVIDADTGDDRIYGGGGDDQILGGAGKDVIYGQNGADVIDGGTEEDYIHGGNDDDRMYGGDQDDEIIGGSGDDFADAGEEDDIVRMGDGDDIVLGGPGNDNIDGGDGDDVLLGEQGDDVIRGKTGDDFIDGGVGDDRLLGYDGQDLILGGAGFDYVNGGNDNDLVYGGADNDELIGGADDDMVIGGDGDDRVVGSEGSDILVGSLNDNDLLVTDPDDTLVEEEDLDDVSLIGQQLQAFKDVFSDGDFDFFEPGQARDKQNVRQWVKDYVDQKKS